LASRIARWASTLLIVGSRHRAYDAAPTSQHPERVGRQGGGRADYPYAEQMPVLGTKVRVPTPRRRLVPRRRLIEQLGVARHTMPRLALLAAPAGFGKTTALIQWLSEDRTDSGTPRRVAWLSLDAGDDDLRQFLGHLIAALQTTGVEVGAEARALMDRGGSLSATAVVVSLVNELDSAAEPTVIALDDYHVIESDDVHEAVAFLLDNLPAQVMLAITSRADPPLPLSRLRARGELVELRATELRFTFDEAAIFLNQVMGLQLSPDQVAALDARTEGWAAGLQLAALSTRGRADDPAAVAAFVNAFTGTNRFVLDYLLEEVLATQPDDVRAFLLDTSILPELSGPLCDALTGRSDGRRTLESLERSNLFVICLDDERQRFRYRHLFAEALAAQLASGHPDRVRRLHLAAAHWHAQHDCLPDAIPHALAGGDADYAGELIELALPDLRRRRQDHLLREWLPVLPEGVVRQRPLLATFVAWSRLSQGDLDGVEHWLDLAESALMTDGRSASAGDDPDPDRSAALRDRAAERRMVPALIEVYRASLAQARGDTAGAVAHAQRGLDLVGPDDHFTRGAAAGFLGLAAWAGGDLRTAVDTFTEAVRSLRLAGNLADALGATVVLASMWLGRGRPDEAQRLYAQALALAEQQSGPALPVTGDLHVGYADMLRERGDLAAAEQHLQIARDLGEPASLLENRHRWFTVRAGLDRARGDLEAAAAMVERAEQLYLPGYFPDIQPLAAVKARIRNAQGRLADAWDWAQTQRVTITDPPTYLNEFDQLTLARLLLARHRTDPGPGLLVAELELLSRIVAIARPAGRLGSVVDALIVRALIQQARGDRDAALDDLGQALDAAAPGGYVRQFLDEGPAMVDLLSAAAAAADRPGAELADALLRIQCAPAAPTAIRVPSTGDDGLSERELEVLRLLASDLTGPEIARHLFVSVNTLRTHTRHIFTKLEVNTRPAAVRRASDLGLL
jgi:LuxR family maltose regulon positive regulatory protein